MKIEKKFIHFSQTPISTEEIEEVVDTLRSGWLTTGPKVKRFEEVFAEYIGCKYAVAVNSCTAALHLALDAIGVEEGDEVITTPMTFAATAEVIRYFKANPIFVDIDPLTMNIDPVKLKESVSRRIGKTCDKKLKAIIPVHYAGYPCDMDSVVHIADRFELNVIEDAAHALPAYYKDRKIGTIGDITCFSFYATKNITTGEGGMAATENEEWAERMRIMSLHGISRDAWKRYTSEGSWYYEILAPGYKYNLTDIAAALGIIQLKKADLFWKRREKIARMYTEAFNNMEELKVPGDIPGSWEHIEKFDNASQLPLEEHLQSSIRHSWHLYVIKLNIEYLSIDRNRFIDELRHRGIGTSVHFIPIHIHPYYRDTYGYLPEDFPVSYDVYKRIISLPIYPTMTDQDVERVIEAVKDVTSKYRN